jgi:hypothetical protein
MKFNLPLITYMCRMDGSTEQNKINAENLRVLNKSEISFLQADTQTSS